MDDLLYPRSPPCDLTSLVMGEGTILLFGTFKLVTLTAEGSVNMH